MATAVSHFAEAETDGRQRRTTFLAYPKYHRAPDGAWRETQERLATSADGWLAEATEGVHTLRVASDGTLVLGHLGRTIRQRLVGIAAVNPAGKPTRTLDIDLSKCVVAVEGNRATWTLPDGGTYEVLYIADAVIDRLTLPVERLDAIRKFLPGGAVAFGPVFEFDDSAWLCDAADIADQDGLTWTIDGRVKQRMRPASVNAREGFVGWAKRRLLRRGSKLLVEAIDVAALDAAEPLVFNATITYQEGVDSYSGWADTFIYASQATTNYATDQSILVGYRDGSHLAIRGLLKCDLKVGEVGYPGSSDTINSATLACWCDSDVSVFYRAGDSTSGDIDCHRVLRNWVVAQATWNVYSTGNSWSTAGAAGSGTDVAASPTDTCGAFSYNDTPAWITWDVRADVAAFVAGTASNYGWRLRTTLDTVPTVWRPPFGSSDWGTTAERPKLTITYTPSAAGNPWWYYQRNAMRRAN